ncbi:ATP-binding cassette domain-containing protein [Gordonia westfalica]|uniref:ATP-binding cassette domain-containing protein n=1 Tax=Gordonia westfalica TaxID=158898 RepID=A0ABU2H0P9_9ACTN|nr:ATP-binding cassette domain-containing protein [Gordonia westfalica]MDS1116830.1 ATP-binding cassette domain-containing protein [Gordonia westfalica]
MRITLLGTGAADGWPNAFCRCGSCADARRRRDFRAQTAALVDDVLMLDFGPDAPGSAARQGVSLAGVDLSLAQGEVHGLLGENGAGKSTLMKVLAGVVTPDAGSVSIDGATLELGRPQASRAAGLGIAYQELSSPGNVDVATKLCWPKLPRGWSGLVSRAKMRDRASEILSRFRLESVDPALLIADADLATRQRVEIVAAMARDPKLLVLDEPTGALPDTDWLFDAVRRLAADGTAVIYISHKLPEIEEICDRGTVLRSGRTVGTFERGSVNETELVEMMIGCSFEQSFPARHAGSGGGVLLHRDEHPDPGGTRCDRGTHGRRPGGRAAADRLRGPDRRQAGRDRRPRCGHRTPSQRREPEVPLLRIAGSRCGMHLPGRTGCAHRQRRGLRIGDPAALRLDGHHARLPRRRAATDWYRSADFHTGTIDETLPELLRSL